MIFANQMPTLEFIGGNRRLNRLAADVRPRNFIAVVKTRIPYLITRPFYTDKVQYVLQQTPAVIHAIYTHSQSSFSYLLNRNGYARARDRYPI